MNKWVEYYLHKQDDPRERRGRKDATVTDTAYRELVLHRWLPNHPTLRKAQAIQWFAEFSEGVMGRVPEPSHLVVNALIDAIEQWLRETTATGSSSRNDWQ